MTESLTTADQSALKLIDTPEFSAQTFLVTLDHYGLLGVEGPDAAKFLQGQVTCDIRELASGVTRLGAQCNIKGRMLVSFRALQLDEQRILLRMHQGLMEKALATFGKYIVFSKAKLHDRTQEYRRIGLSGPAAETLLRSVFTDVPEQVDAWFASDDHIITKLDTQRYECWLGADAEEIIATLSATTVPAGENLWTLLDIRAGIGEVRPESHELFTPQALNYQLVNAVNFRKGCYTGQEIVARLHYRGTLKRHMHRIGFEADQEVPRPGTPINNSQGSSIGEIVMAARAGQDRMEALANIVDEQLTDAWQGDKKVEPMSLPYAIPSEEKN
ncbi:MAG: hypothetical protein WA987_01750 [Cellvibrio sp.]